MPGNEIHEPAHTEGDAGVSPMPEPALADRLFELVGRLRRPRPIGPPTEEGREAEELHRQRHGQIRMLIVLAHEGPLTVQDLARVLDVSTPSASVMAKKAVEEGLVERRRDEHDSRVVWLELAEYGRQHLESHRAERIRRFDRLIDSHPELDRAQIGKAVDILLQLFDRDPRTSAASPDSEGQRCGGVQLAGRSKEQA